MTVVRHRIEVGSEDDGVRLDQLLARRVDGLSRRKARMLIDLGGVYVDRARVKVASRPVRSGQIVEAVIGGVLARSGEAPSPPPSFEIVHQDEQIVVVDKPAGLITAPTPESDRGNLFDLLLRRDEGPVWLVHRIDRATSGLLVFARTPEANRFLAERFARHDIEREYVAVVAGTVAADTTLDRPIQGKRAVTHVRVVEPLPDATRIAARLETGRTHQIRIHAVGAGHPVLGDAQHGGDLARRYRDRPPRLALHAAILGFAHPATGTAMRFESPIPADLAGWLSRLRAASHP